MYFMLVSLHDEGTDKQSMVSSLLSYDECFRAFNHVGDLCYLNTSVC